MYQNDNLRPEVTQSGNGDQPAYEVRVDGTAVARGPKVEEVLRIALDRKQRLPEQIVGVHELTFNRAWTIDRNGRIISANS